MNNISIKTNNGESIEIPLYNRIMIITGNSASGKTKMLKMLNACKNVHQEVKESSINVDDIVIITDKHQLRSIIDNNVKGKYIFIDHYSFMENDKSIYNFIKTSNNIFVIMGHRNAKGLAIQDAILTLEHDGKNYTCKQVYEHGLFKPLVQV